jgi:Predicted permeases
MITLARYLSRKLTTHTLLVLFALVALSLTFELMERADNVLALSGDNPTAVLAYAALRTPDFVARQLPMAVLVGALITFGMLRRYDELIAMWGSGVSALGMMKALIPISILIGALQFGLDNAAVPWVEAVLRDRGLGEVGRKGLIEKEMSATWLRSSQDVIRIPKEVAQQGELRDVSIFRRDATGTLVERLDAKSATPAPDGWQLANVTARTVEPAQITTYASLLWKGHIDIGQLPLLASEQRDLSLAEISFLIDNEGFGQRPTDLFRTWWQHRIAATLAPLLVVCLVISLAQRFHRSGDFSYLMFMGLGFGFVFFVLDGISLALGEAALLPPTVSAWAAEFILVCLIAAFTIQAEG